MLDFFSVVQKDLHRNVFLVLHTTLRGQRGGNRREYRDGDVKDGLPNLLVHGDLGIKVVRQFRVF